jgi:hypothetical protein
MAKTFLRRAYNELVDMSEIIIDDERYGGAAPAISN